MDADRWAGDHIRVAVEQQIPVAAAAPLQLNLKPGLGGLEVITGGIPVDARVEPREGSLNA